MKKMPFIKWGDEVFRKKWLEFEKCFLNKLQIETFRAQALLALAHFIAIPTDQFRLFPPYYFGF